MKVIAWCVNTLHFYVVISKAIIFTLGLIFTYSFVEQSLFSTLVTSLTEDWEEKNLPKAATIVYLYEGTVAISQIFFAFVADAYSGLFSMVFCSTALYTILLSKVSAIAMVVAFLWFLLGTKFYSFTKPTGSALSDVAFVIYTAITKRNLDYPEAPEQLFQNSSGLVQILPHLPWLRWLDRAAIMVQDEEKPGDTNNNNICSVEQVKGVKFLFKMLPMWTTFLTFSMVVATGSTFFLQEAVNRDGKFPVLVLIYLREFFNFAVGNICDSLLEKLCEKKKKNIVQKAMLVRIGVGMIFCVLCCITALVNSKKIRRHPLGSGSIFMPQYILLGIMEGLSVDGLNNFYDSQVTMSLSRYGPPFGECVLSIGKFLSALSLLILGKRKWFTSDLQTSRLYKYYGVLAFLSSANLMIYVFVAAYSYGEEKFLAEDQANIETVGLLGTLQEEGLTELQDSLRVRGQQTAETANGDIKSGDQNGASNDKLLTETSSFPPRLSSKGMYRRFNTMH